MIIGMAQYRDLGTFLGLHDDELGVYWETSIYFGVMTTT